MLHPFLADTSGTTGAAAVGGLFLFFVLLAVLYLALWLYCIINAATRTDFDGSQRIIWIVVLLFLHGLGPILYLIFARKSAP
jgi:hypothetical protein